MRKGIVIILMVVLCMGTAACSNNLFIDSGEKVDTTKTQLYVSNYAGGVGSEWLEKAAARFSETYKDTEFTPGKKGVQILINPNKEMRVDLEDTLRNGPTDEVFFGEHMYYSKWAEAGYLLDITDMVQENLPGENQSIEDKLSADKKAMLTSPRGKWDAGQFTSGGKYYGLPHYEGFQGVTYNVTLFDRNNLYFNANGGIIAEAGGTKSAGPDGVLGNSDDGLPASIEQFMELCEYMALATPVTPFVWTGMYSEYFTILLDAMVTAQLGKAGSEVLYNFNENLDGAAKTVSTVITGFSGGVPQLGTTVIDETTGYLLWKQSALYYALQFADELLNSKNNGRGQWYTNSSVNGSYDHLQAQADFINGSFDSKNQIGMLIDGNYWENEASEAIARSESTYNYNYDETGNFAWMPLPGAATGDTGSANLTLKDAMQSYAFIYSGIAEEKIELAKTFLQFCYTDESLKEFTLTTGSTRDISYDLTESEISSLSKYAQSIWNYRKTADIVNTASVYPVFQANEETLVNTFWKTQGTGLTQDRPYTAFWTDKLTAVQFFNGMAGLHTRNSWDTENRNYYVMHDMQSDEVIS